MGGDPRRTDCAVTQVRLIGRKRGVNESGEDGTEKKTSGAPCAVPLDSRSPERSVLVQRVVLLYAPFGSVAFHDYVV